MILRGRDFPSVLGTNADRTQDIVPGIYLGPVGTRLHRVLKKGTDTPVIVTSAQGGKTWPPGAEVALGSYGQKSAPFILGDPPPGHSGGARFASRSYPAGPAPEEEEPPPPPPPEPPYHVLLEAPGYPDVNGTELTAATYDEDGAWVADRRVHDFGDLPDLAASGLLASGAQVIRSDPNGTVGAYSYLLNPFGRLLVWDVADDEVHTLVPLDSHGNEAATRPLWHGGYVYWAQIDYVTGASIYTYTLYRSVADLSAPTALGSFDVTAGGAQFDLELTGGKSSRASSSRYYARPSVLGDVIGFRFEVISFAWDGSGGARTAGSGWTSQSANLVPGLERPDLSDTSLAARDSGSVLTSVSSANATTNLWPSASGGVVSVDVLDSEALVLVRSFDGAIWAHAAYRDLPATTTPNPSTVDSHPSGMLPGSMFIRA